MATDRKEICDKIFNGARTPAKDFTSPVLDGWTENVEGNEVLAFNPNEAKRLWAEANKISEWSGKFVLAYNNDGAGNKEFSEAMTNQLKNNLGIDAAPKVYATFDELRTDITDRSIKTPFRTGWQADYPSMLNYLGPIYATGAGSNDGDYSNKQFDKLVSDAAAAKGDARYKLIGEAQTILLKDLPATSAVVPERHRGHHEGPQGVPRSTGSRSPTTTHSPSSRPTATDGGSPLGLSPSAKADAVR